MALRLWQKINISRILIFYAHLGKIKNIDNELELVVPNLKQNGAFLSSWARPISTEDGSMWNFLSSLTHSRWFCGIAAVGAIGASVRSGRALADEGFFVITRGIIPLKVGIL